MIDRWAEMPTCPDWLDVERYSRQDIWQIKKINKKSDQITDLTWCVLIGVWKHMRNLNLALKKMAFILVVNKAGWHPDKSQVVLVSAGERAE